MAGWHVRLWRRIRVAPGIRINLSKSGPSLSVGPPGSHVTLGPRGTRQTVGIPGTGLFATRTLDGSRTPTAGEAADAGPAAVEIAPTSMPAGARDYVAAVCVSIGLGLVLLWLHVSPAAAIVSGVVAAGVGIGYEWLAHNHPVAVRRLLAVLAGLLTIAGAIAVAVTVVVGVVLLIAGASGGGSRRRR